MKNEILLKLLFLLCITTIMQAEALNMVLSEKEDSEIFKRAKLLVEKINEEANIEINLISMPRKRAEIELQKNEYVQATAARIIEFQENKPNLIRVKEPIIRVPLVIYSYTTLDIKSANFQNLRQYNVAYVRGTTYIEKYFKNHKKLIALTSEIQAFRFLAAKRADILISSPLLTSSILSSKEFKNSGIKMFPTPLKYVNIYSFFNKEYKDVAQKFNDALIVLKKNGVYSSILLKK